MCESTKQNLGVACSKFKIDGLEQADITSVLSDLVYRSWSSNSDLFNVSPSHNYVCGSCRGRPRGKTLSVRSLLWLLDRAHCNLSFVSLISGCNCQDEANRRLSPNVLTTRKSCLLAIFPVANKNLPPVEMRYAFWLLLKLCQTRNASLYFLGLLSDLHADCLLAICRSGHA